MLEMEDDGAYARVGPDGASGRSDACCLLIIIAVRRERERGTVWSSFHQNDSQTSEFLMDLGAADVAVKPGLEPSVEKDEIHNKNRETHRTLSCVLEREDVVI